MLLCELLDELIAEHLLDLFGRDRKIVAVADPRLHEVAEALLLELLHQAVEAVAGAVIGNQRRGQGGQHLRFVAAAEDGTENGVEEAHG